MSELEDLAFDQAIRSIEHQKDAVATVRERVGSLIARASIATSFLGSTALEGPGPPNFGAWTAMLLFVATIGGAIYVLWARTTWNFDLDSKEILEKGESSDIADIKRELADWMEEHYANNARQLDQMIRGLQCGRSWTRLGGRSLVGGYRREVMKTPSKTNQATRSPRKTSKKDSTSGARRIFTRDPGHGSRLAETRRAKKKKSG